MNFNRYIILRVLRDNRIAVAAFSSTALVILFCYLGFFTVINSQGSHIGEVIRRLPQLPNLRVSHQAALKTVEEILANTIYGWLWPLAAIVLATHLAANAVAAKIEQGSLGLLLTLPLSRRQIIDSTYTAGLMSVTIFTLLPTLFILPIAPAYDYNLPSGHFLALALTIWLFAWALYSFAFMLSCLSSRRSQVYLGVAGTLFVMGLFTSPSNPLRWLSFFSYFNPQSALLGGYVSGVAVLVLTLVSVTCAHIGIRRFAGRDFFI